jgi:hypothetical protein
MKTTEVNRKLEETSNTRNLEILIQGLALSHFDENAKKWKVFFPKALHHDLWVRVVKKREITIDGRVGYKGEGENQYHFNSVKKFEIVTNNEKGQASVTKGSTDTIPDLSELHERTIKLVSDINKFSGFLTINDGVMKTNNREKVKNFKIWKIKTSESMVHKKLHESKILGIAAILEFSYASGSKTEIAVEDENIEPIIHEDGITYQIIFDNDCHGSKEDCSESDFKYYYDIIDNSNLDGIRFDLELDEPASKGDPGGICGKGIVSELEQNFI